jgi:hypothetical protein
MTHLRTITIEELVRRNYSDATRECYIRGIEDFALYFNYPPDKLGLEHIRHYQAHLFTDKKLSPNTVNQRLTALRFFFVKTLHRLLLRSWLGFVEFCLKKRCPGFAIDGDFSFLRKTRQICCKYFRNPRQILLSADDKLP